MKRYIALLLCMMLLLTACAVPDPTPTDGPTGEPTDGTTTAPTQPAASQPDVTEPTVPAGTEPLVYDLPMSAITLTQQAETAADDSGNTVFTYSYQNVRLLLADDGVSQAVTLDLLNRIDATRAAADSIRSDALSDSPEYPYSLSVQYVPQRIDSALLSLSGQQTSYSGGAHPNTSCTGVTYDLLTGSVLGLGDILAIDCTADVICRLVVDALGTMTETHYLYEDFSVTVEERFSGDYLADDAWHLSGEGLCFSFAPYEVAPYSSGVVTAVIPYEQLTGILMDAYFPVERVAADGALNAVLFDDADHSQFAQYAEVILEQEGESFLLSTDRLIYDVVIEYGSWNMDGTVFTPEAAVFAAGSLIPSDAILVQTYVPDTMPNLRITYTSGDATLQVYLSQSGRDGSALLLTD